MCDHKQGSGEVVHYTHALHMADLLASHVHSIPLNVLHRNPHNVAHPKLCEFAQVLPPEHVFQCVKTVLVSVVVGRHHLVLLLVVGRTAIELSDGTVVIRQLMCGTWPLQLGHHLDTHQVASSNLGCITWGCAPIFEHACTLLHLP